MTTFTELLTVHAAERAASDPSDADDAFEAESVSTGSSHRLFGGLVAGQAIRAAARTVEADRSLHSAQATYLLAGDDALPVRYLVTRLRDGRTFSTRSVEARQGERVIFTMIASFQTAAEGLHHQVPVPSTPDPDWLPDAVSMAADPTSSAWYRTMLRGRPIELRVPEEPTRLANLRGKLRPATQRMWVRSTDRLPDDEVLHDAAITYCSDFLMLSAALGPHPELAEERELQFATINHSIWFHAPARADEWFLHEVESPWAGEGRAFTRGNLFDRNGALIASTAQEGLMRTPRR